VLNLALFDGTQVHQRQLGAGYRRGGDGDQGDKTSAVRDYIAAGRITGYGGTGTVVWEYNVTHPGKTTVTAIPGQITPNWRVATTVHPTDDWVITPFDAAVDFGIVADGVTDVTEEIQTALVMIANLGGGALFLPAGHYKVAGNLNIPSGVTLRGDWRKPEPGEAVSGTVLMAYAGRDQRERHAFHHPQQQRGSERLVDLVSRAIARRHPSLSADHRQRRRGHGRECHLRQLLLGLHQFVNGTTARPFLRNLCGTPLKLGIEFDCLADIGRVETVHFSPDYWADSGLARLANGQ
jgi:hypothetical protein